MKWKIICVCWVSYRVHGHHSIWCIIKAFSLANNNHLLGVWAAYDNAEIHIKLVLNDLIQCTVKSTLSHTILWYMHCGYAKICKLQSCSTYGFQQTFGSKLVSNEAACSSFNVFGLDRLCIYSPSYGKQFGLRCIAHNLVGKTLNNSIIELLSTNL